MQEAPRKESLFFYRRMSAVHSGCHPGCVTSVNNWKLVVLQQGSLFHPLKDCVIEQAVLLNADML